MAPNVGLAAEISLLRIARCPKPKLAVRKAGSPVGAVWQKQSGMEFKVVRRGAEELYIYSAKLRAVWREGRRNAGVQVREMTDDEPGDVLQTAGGRGLEEGKNRWH